MPELHLIAVLHSEKAPSTALVISRFPCVLGRAADCDYQLDSLRVSRRHCAFSVRDGRMWIEDLGSRNGTRLNGDSITEARPIADGDVLQLGSFSFQVRFQETLPAQGPVGQNEMGASSRR
jgi:pSer/pThr/pTyr-binding forkhead associated (FHA) protein